MTRTIHYRGSVIEVTDVGGEFWASIDGEEIPHGFPSPLEAVDYARRRINRKAKPRRRDPLGWVSDSEFRRELARAELMADMRFAARIKAEFGLTYEWDDLADLRRRAGLTEEA